jgi:hypothetical protein
VTFETADRTTSGSAGLACVRSGTKAGQPAYASEKERTLTSHEWGRVADDGTVFVRTAAGERAVGQYPAGTSEEALRFYSDRYASLEFEVSLLEQRVRAGLLGPDDATRAMATLRGQVADANAVGDLVALTERVDALSTVVTEQRQVRKAERAAKAAEVAVKKEELVAASEKLAQGNDWRHGASRLRDLLAQWKALPRLERAADDALWGRFSSARTTYTRRRKTHFAAQDEKREGARLVKQRLVTQAEKLASSREWGPTTGAFRDLMRDWKAAGPAPKEVDDELWQRFRGAQDIFFAARNAENAKVDEEYHANATVKEQLLNEAEALLPVTDLKAAKAALRSIAERWEAIGKVPRDRMKDLEGRMRAVEQALRGIDDDRWRRTDPEKSARADDMVTKLTDAIAGVEAELAQARTAGNDKAIDELEDSLAARRAFLEAAQRAATEFSG